MRLALTTIAVLGAISLAGCDETPAPPEALATSVDTDAAALKNAAQKECAEVTNYLPEKIQSMTPEMRALTEREYNLCVSKVAGGS